MFDRINALRLVLMVQYQQIRKAQRAAAIKRQEDFVAQLGGAYDNYPFADYWERYQHELAKLERLQRS